MLSAASNRRQLRAHLEGVRAALDNPSLHGDVAAAAERLPGAGAPRDKVASLLDVDIEHSQAISLRAMQPPYLARAPVTSLVQSHIEEARSLHGIEPEHPESLCWRILHVIERALHMSPGTFTREDPDWYVAIAQGVLEHIANGNAPFNEVPAEHALEDDARLVVVGDWGTGLQRARDVAEQMSVTVTEALDAGRQVHVIHLGDVYYSGMEGEDQERFLDYWPVTDDQAAAGVSSWCLIGNHDMYSGGFGYFGTILADRRFASQRSPDGTPTSYFRLRGTAWDFVGLDTAWDRNVLADGRAGVLEEPQGDYVRDVAAESTRKLALLSHHPMVSAYDAHDLDPILGAKLGSVLTDNRIRAWWWGHEHRAITYEAAGGVQYPRCVGNGGVPMPPDADPGPSVRPAITWHSTRTKREHGRKWTRAGFAVLDLDADRIRVQYIDDDGHVAHTETVD